MSIPVHFFWSQLICLLCWACCNVYMWFFDKSHIQQWYKKKRSPKSLFHQPSYFWPKITFLPINQYLLNQFYRETSFVHMYSIVSIFSAIYFPPLIPMRARSGLTKFCPGLVFQISSGVFNQQSTKSRSVDL